MGIKNDDDKMANNKQSQQSQQQQKKIVVIGYAAEAAAIKDTVQQLIFRQHGNDDLRLLNKAIVHVKCKSSKQKRAVLSENGPMSIPEIIQVPQP